ncbi:M90 family metallopeptidase [Flavisolibacter nicotianae]|uniref:M90 family metallopeptidase n=1 Tax=Flavisolibacter nicotianae TaxID=2364882 RepID=UPI000EAD8BE2|nr:M90 family metallopeptidase [Flavisolibacter nicotianae]
MITVLQILFVLFLIVLIIRLVFQSRRPEALVLPENTEEILADYVIFYAGLDEDGRAIFLDKMKRFLSAVKITGANAEVEDLDRILIGAAAVMPVFYIPDWEYINLREILLYPGNFNTDYEQQGNERLVSGMVGTGSLENIMILSKWELRQGFINRKNNRNMALHEFVHLIDKMDGSLDGVPEILLQRKFVPQWKQLLEQEMENVRRGQSDIDLYAATSPVECFAVVSEYFFEQPEIFSEQHPDLHALLQQIFIRK